MAVASGDLAIDVVVLAGGEDHGEIAAQTGIIYRPLLEVGGRAIIGRLLEALRASPAIGRIALVAPGPVLEAVPDGGVELRLPAGDSFIGNMLAGVEALASDHVLIVTGDLPLLTREAVDDLVDQSLRSGAEITYPVIPREVSEQRFPGGRRTYARLRDGVFTGGNAVLVSRDFVTRRRDLISSLFEARKSPLRLAALFGAGFIIRLATGRLSLARIEQRAQALLGVKAKAIISHYPELGFDVDKLADLHAARQAAESP
jgi:GTP:adenosylcobinamide-phosphate guanylyltransferase